jgi:hypothetical protein
MTKAMDSALLQLATLVLLIGRARVNAELNMPEIFWISNVLFFRGEISMGQVGQVPVLLKYFGTKKGAFCTIYKYCKKFLFRKEVGIRQTLTINFKPFFKKTSE